MKSFFRYKVETFFNDFFQKLWNFLKIFFMVFGMISFFVVMLVVIALFADGTAKPKSTATKAPTAVMASQPTKATARPTARLTATPTVKPTARPTVKPTAKPTATTVPKPKTDIVLYKDSNIIITSTGDIELDYMGTLEIGIIVENKSSRNITISYDNVCCNDWTLSSLAVTQVPAKKKARDTLSFYNADEDANLESIYDVKTIEMDLAYYDSDTWKDLNKPVHLTWEYKY